MTDFNHINLGGCQRLFWFFWGLDIVDGVDGSVLGGQAVLGGAEFDAGFLKALTGDFGKESADFGPWDQEMRGFSVQLGGVHAENGVGASAEDGLLLLDDGGFGVPDALGVHGFCGKERYVELPEFQAPADGFTKQDGLAA